MLTNSPCIQVPANKLKLQYHLRTQGEYKQTASRMQIPHPWGVWRPKMSNFRRGRGTPSFGGRLESCSKIMKSPTKKQTMGVGKWKKEDNARKIFSTLLGIVQSNKQEALSIATTRHTDILKISFWAITFRPPCAAWNFSQWPEKSIKKFCVLYQGCSLICRQIGASGTLGGKGGTAWLACISQFLQRGNRTIP